MCTHVHRAHLCWSYQHVAIYIPHYPGFLCRCQLLLWVNELFGTALQSSQTSYQSFVDRHQYEGESTIADALANYDRKKLKVQKPAAITAKLFGELKAFHEGMFVCLLSFICLLLSSACLLFVCHSYLLLVLFIYHSSAIGHSFTVDEYIQCLPARFKGNGNNNERAKI